MKTLKFLVVFVCTLVSFSAFAASDSSKYVTYEGKTFEIAVFNQEDAERIIGSAKAVYAFQVADCDLTVGPRGNSSDHCESFKNAETGEYAVEVWYKKDGKYIYSYVIFSLKGARIENTLPNGFEFCEYSEFSIVGYGQKAGWCPANLNGVHNSMIVYIK